MRAIVGLLVNLPELLKRLEDDVDEFARLRRDRRPEIESISVPAPSTARDFAPGFGVLVRRRFEYGTMLAVVLCSQSTMMGIRQLSLAPKRSLELTYFAKAQPRQRKSLAPKLERWRSRNNVSQMTSTNRRSLCVPPRGYEKCQRHNASFGARTRVTTHER